MTRDSLGTVPVCFVDNEDFSDMVESVGRTPAAIKTYVDGEGKLTGQGCINFPNTQFYIPL